MKRLAALRAYRRLWLPGIPLLLALVAIAWYAATSPRRAEQALQQASFLELQYEAQRNPDNPRIFHYLGLTAQRAGQKQLALDSFGQAATMAPHDEAAWITWARAAAAIQGSQAAINILNTYLQVHPRSAESHLMLAQICAELADHPRAYAEAKIATEQNPRSDRAWRLAGKEALKKYDASAAEEAFRRAITLAPADWENQQGLGDALFASSRFPEAVKFYREAVRLAPNVGVTHLKLGEALLRTAGSAKEIEAARESLRRALAHQDTLTSDGLFFTYLALGQSYTAEERWQEALPWLKQAVPYEPTDATISGEVHFELARAYRGLRDPANAQREMRLHEQRKLYNVQLKQLSNRIRTNRDDVQAYLSLARLYVAHGNDTDAAYLYRQALLRAPDLKGARQEYAALLRRHTPSGKQEREPSR
ncbi:MAG TPA: tetratricopeptide repeat protein [Chthonomonadaceae bacterium]|nr:tetratricopeptide repeat protein [Chthonomonadaceae bacterium]